MAGLAPDLYWLDSSELAAAAWQLGVAHPPGHGSAALVGKALTLLPLGTVALRVGLASSLAGALAAMQAARLARDLSARLRRTLDGQPSPRVDAALGAAAGLTFSLSYAAGFQAVRPEVYALSAFLVLSALYELQRFDDTGDRRRLYAASVWAGLALTNHHLLALAALVPAAAIVLARRPSSTLAPALARVLAGGTLGLALIAYLPLRASRHPLVDWGAPLTLGRTFWTVSAKAFQKAVASRGTPADLPAVAAALTRELWLIGALLAVGGAYLLVRLPSLRRIGLALLAAALLDAAMPALVGFDPANPDAYGYLEVAVALLAIIAIVLPSVLTTRLRSPRLALAGASSLTVAALVGGVLTFPRISLANDWNAAQTFERYLATVPPRALLVTSYFQTVFGVWYLSAVEGARPDVDLVHRHFLAYPGYRDELLLKRPELSSLLGDRDVTSLPADRPVDAEYDLDLPSSLLPHSRIVPFDPSVTEPQAHRFAGWQAFLAAHRACRLGDHALAARTLADARALFGASPELDELAQRCR